MIKELDIKDKDFNIPLCFDYKFKRIFGDSENISNLESLISILFNVPYNDVKGNVRILNNEKLINHKKQKKGAMDVYLNLTLVNGKYKINLEVSNHVLAKSTIDRNLSYISYIFSNQLNSSEDYNLLMPCITICLDRGLQNIEENDEIVNIYELRDDKAKKLTDKLQFWHINIDNCYNLWYSKNVDKYEKAKQNIILLGALLSTRNINEFNKCLGGIPMSKEIKENIKETNEELNEYDELMSWYDYDRDQRAIRNGEISCAKREARQEGLEEGRQEGIKEGIRQGIEQNNIETAKKFKNLGVDINIISKATGLSIEEINKL